jgi:adenosine deaminase
MVNGLRDRGADTGGDPRIAGFHRRAGSLPRNRTSRLPGGCGSVAGAGRPAYTAPKVDLPDLHRHLDGSIRCATLAELLATAGRSLPDDLLFHAGMGLSGALSRFAVTLSVLQQPAAVRRVADEICRDAAGDRVTTLEIRFAPQLHQQEGAALEAIVDAAVEGCAGRAGLLLCGLYGEAPGVLDRLVEVAGPRSGVVGIDLAGGPSTDRFEFSTYASAFRRAAELGLGRTVHAGEGRPAGEIRAAIVELGAQRIGHGTTLLEDGSVLELVIERGVTVEACPTSNVHTGAVADVAEHPLPRWLDLGVRACVNTDNTLFSDTTSSAEHLRAARIPGMDAERLARAIQFGHAAAFRR